MAKKFDLDDLNTNYDIKISEIKKKLGNNKYLAIIDLSEKSVPAPSTSTRKRRRSSRRISYDDEFISESDPEYEPDAEPKPRRVSHGKSKLLRTSTRPSSGEEFSDSEDNDFIADDEENKEEEVSESEASEINDSNVKKKKEKPKPANLPKRKTRSTPESRHSGRIDRAQSLKDKKAKMFEKIKKHKNPELKEDEAVMIDSDEDTARKRKKLKRVIRESDSEPECVNIPSTDEEEEDAGAPKSRRKTPRKKMVIEDEEEEAEPEAEIPEEQEDSESESEPEQKVAKYKLEGMKFFQRLSLEESFTVMIEIYLNGTFDPQFLKSSTLSQLDNYEDCLGPALTKVDDCLNSKRNLAFSSAWSNEFTTALNKYPDLRQDMHDSDWARDDCEACNRTNRPWSIEFAFSGKPYDPVTMEDLLEDENEEEEENSDSDQEEKPKVDFKVGCFCGDRASVYHDLYHFKHELMLSCRQKVSYLPNKEQEEVVKEIMENKEWVDMEFTFLKTKLAAPEKFLEDSPDKRRSSWR